MDPTTYQQTCTETASYPNIGRALYYPALGLVDELGELIEKVEANAPLEEIAKEFGDCFWYAAQVCTECSLGFGLVNPPRITQLRRQNFTIGVLQQAMIKASKVAGLVKKVIRDSDYLESGRIDPVKCSKISLYIGEIFKDLSSAATFWHLTPGKIMLMNAEKLAGRVKRGTLHGDGDNR